MAPTIYESDAGFYETKGWVGWKTFECPRVKRGQTFWWEGVGPKSGWIGVDGVKQTVILLCHCFPISGSEANACDTHLVKFQGVEIVRVHRRDA